MNISENTIKWLKIGGIILLISAIFLTGLFIGRKHTKVVEKEVIKYVTLPPIHDSIPAPYPVKEKIDTINFLVDCVKKGVYQELFPNRKDTVYLTQKDTSELLKDWATERDYNVNLFDSDTLGTCTINTKVQYNRLGKIGYTFTPKQKQSIQYVEVKKNYIPFVGAGISTFPSVGAEVGMFFNQSWGFALEGNYFFNPNKIENMPKYDVGLKVVKMF